VQPAGLTFVLPIRLFLLLSLRNYTPRYLNFLTCCCITDLDLERQHLGLFRYKLHSNLVADSWESIRCVKKVPIRGWKQHQIVRKNNRLILQFPTVTLTLSRLLLSVRFFYTRGLQTFLSEGHISYYRTYRGPGILRNVIVLGHVTICQINKILVIFFHHLTKWLRGPDEMASQAAFGPRAVVWTPLFYTIRGVVKTHTPVRSST